LVFFRESRELSQTSCWGEGKQRREKQAEQKASFDAQFASAFGRGNIALVHFIVKRNFVLIIN
jgi:hypothetical protein